MKLKDLRDQQILQFMYSLVNGKLPLPLQHIFEYQRDIHGYITRHVNDPRPMRANTELMNKSLLCRGPQMWMELEGNIKAAKTKKIFKRRFLGSKLATY